MKTDWHSVKLEGFPPEAGRYLVTIEGVLEDVEGIDLLPGERSVVTARYFGSRDWGLRDGTYRVVAWTYLPEIYMGKI